MKLNYKRTILVGFAFFLISAFWQAYDAIVPVTLVNKYGLNQMWSGMIMAADNILAVILLPVFGALSDRTKHKMGKRTPFILVGAILSIVLFIGMTFADNRQLKNVYEQKDGETFAAELWEENFDIPDVEKLGAEDLSTRDYAAKIYYNKDYSSLNAAQRETLKKNFLSLANPEVENADETPLMYSYENGEYKVEKDGRFSARTNVFVAARTAYAAEVTRNNVVPMIVFMCILLLLLVSMATFRSPAVALMPDVTVKPLRSKANAIINLMGAAGGIIVLGLGIVFGTGKFGNQMMSYTFFVSAVSLIMAVGLVIFLLKVREPKWAKEMQEAQARFDAEAPEEEKPIGGTERLGRAKVASLVLILASVFLWYMGYNAVTSKYALYATNVLDKDYNTTMIVAQAAAIISYVPVGIVASKLGRKKTILAGVVMLAAAFTGAIFANANTPLAIMYLIFALAGIGWATINVNSFPMVVELSKNGNVGRYTGFYYTASMAAQAITPWISGVIMDKMGSMLPLFPYAAIFVGLAFVTMLFVRHGDSRPERQGALESLAGADD